MFKDAAQRTSQLTSQLFAPGVLGAASTNDNPFLEETKKQMKLDGDKRSITPQVHTMNPYEQIVGKEEEKSAGSPLPVPKARPSITRDEGGEFEFEVDISADNDTPVDVPGVAPEEEKKMKEISVSVSTKKEVTSSMKSKNEATTKVTGRKTPQSTINLAGAKAARDDKSPSLAEDD